MDTLLGTVVTVLVAWTEFRYAIGNPSLGTKSVATTGRSIVRKVKEAKVLISLSGKVSYLNLGDL